VLRGHASETALGDGIVAIANVGSLTITDSFHWAFDGAREVTEEFYFEATKSSPSGHGASMLMRGQRAPDSSWGCTCVAVSGHRPGLKRLSRSVRLA
jgi:hypothetical protein